MPTKLIFFSKHGHPSSSQTLSAPSMELTQFKYDVFLSFRGEDTRNNFTSHLHKALCNKHIETFIDYELRRGDEISPSLLKAIEESNISVIVFSKGYASSRWCLEELVKILQCKNTYGQIVVPIFYEVDPSDVRNQTGSFAQAFAEHEERFMESLDKVQTWRNALNKAANLVGLDSGVIKPESVLIENIVQDVLRRLKDMYSNDNNGLIGINSRINEIESLLQIGLKAVRSIGLWGVGGVGKTSLAGAVFEKISYQFEGSCFVHNVKEESERNGGLKLLRQELYCAILGDKNVNMSISFGGCTFTKKRFGRMKLLVVFDDVTDFRQIEYLIGGFDCLGLGSRIIMTTRNKQVLKNCRVDKIYEVEELLSRDAFELFCQHAFRQNRPILEYENLSLNVVNYLGGIPLALKVLGSSLLDKGKEVWESAIKKLEKILDKDIYEVLKISYDGLNDNQQKIFLDIACFLKGRNIDLVKQSLNACGFFVDVEISGLVDKSLIVISSDNTITMHNLLQAMGREIVRQQSIDDLGQRTRLWHHEDIYHVLTKNMGSKAIEGISFDMSKTKHIDLNPCAFTNMRNMRFLEFYCSNYDTTEKKVHVSEGLDFAPNELRYLHWDGCPIKSLQSDFYPQHLVILRMRDSNIKQLWNGVLQLVNLKEINLCGSKQLIICPDLSGARNLEKIFLNDCTSLLEIPSSLQYLSKLTGLCLFGCKSLKGLPDCFTALKSLEMLMLGDCTSLKLLPEMPCNIERLNVRGTAVEVFPAIDNLSKLVFLGLGNCSRLKSIPSSIGKQKSLEFLYLGPCSNIDKLLDDIGTLKSLRELEVVGSAIREAPSSIVPFSNPETLSFKRCKFQDLNLFMLALLGWCSLTELHLTDCGITAIPDSLCHLSQLQILYLGRNNFESIPASIINLFKLRWLDISFCQRLLFLPELPSTSIYADNCFSLAAVPLSILCPSRIMPDFHVRFTNCFNLQNGPNDIVEDVLLKLTSVPGFGYTPCVQRNGCPPSTSICFPGSEVPEWFGFRSTGSLITKELPPGLNYYFEGFAMCAVVEIQHHQIEFASDLDVRCEYKLKSKDGQWHTFCGSLVGRDFRRSESYYVESDHLYIGIHHLSHPRDIIDDSCYNTEVTFQFYLEFKCRRIECCKVKSCGVRLMHAQDAGKSNGSFNLDEREDEPHPKRLKSVELL